VITWRDKDMKYREKVYDTYPEIVKAKKWLIENNAEDIDIAVRVVKPLHQDTNSYIENEDN
jgi:hypothetical protein